jgi:hypothetical protein
VEEEGRADRATEKDKKDISIAMETQKLGW